MKDDARIAADSTMLRIVNRFIALSLGVHLEQLEQRIGLTWPLPFLLRPLHHMHQHLQAYRVQRKLYLEARFLTMAADLGGVSDLNVPTAHRSDIE